MSLGLLVVGRIGIAYKTLKPTITILYQNNANIGGILFNNYETTVNDQQIFQIRYMFIFQGILGKARANKLMKKQYEVNQSVEKDGKT